MAISVVHHFLSSLWSNGTGAITTATPNFVDASAGEAFTTTKITNYPNIGIVGAGAAGSDLQTTITTAVTGSAATLAGNAGTTVTAANWAWANSVCDTNAAGTVLSGTCGAIAKGDGIAVAITCEQTLTISSVADTIGNIYQPVKKTTPTSPTAFVVWYVCLSSKSAASTGTNKITVTFSGNPFTAGNAAGATLDVYGATPGVGNTLIIDVTTSGTGSSTAPSSGNFSTKYKSEVVFAAPTAESQVTGSTAGWTPTTQNPYTFLSEFQIFSTIQSGIAATFTTASSTPWAVGLLGLAEVPAANAIFYGAD